MPGRTGRWAIGVEVFKSAGYDEENASNNLNQFVRSKKEILEDKILNIVVLNSSKRREMTFLEARKDIIHQCSDFGSHRADYWIRFFMVGPRPEFYVKE